MAREGKPETSYRHVIEQQTELLLQRGDVSRWDEPGREYFHRPGELLVQLSRVPEISKRLSELQAEQLYADEQVGLAAYRLPPDRGVHETTLALAKDVGPGAVSPHHVMFGVPRLRACPGRPPFPGSPLALDAGGDAGTGVVIAVIDTGQAEQSFQVDWVRDHVSADDVDFDELDASGDGELDLEAGHGTFIAGVIAQVAPGAKVLARKAVDTWGVTDDIAVARAVRRAVADGAHIINLSLGGYTMDDQPPLGVDALLPKEKQSSDGVVYVAAAGNDAVDRPFYPAALPGVIGVAALNSSRRRAGFSNFGPWVQASAEGERLLSTFVVGTVMTDSDGNGRKDVFEEGYAHWSGTSFAAPQVSAAIAARMSATGESAADAAFALVLDPSLTRRTGLGVQVRTPVRSHPARPGLP
jgi:subtilisin family serine protease